MKHFESNSSTPFIHIQPKKGWRLLNFGELREYRDLFYFLVLRDIKVKYKQTVLGVMWAALQPFFSMIIFTIFFGKLAKMPSDGIPYPVFNYTAMLLWTYFSTSISTSGNSLISNTSYITKVYFPRLIIPIAPIIAGLIDFFIAFFLLLAMMVYYKIYPGVQLLFVPFLVLLMMISASGVGMMLAALNAKYRDIKYTIPFLIQLWMFASPIVYPASLVPKQFKILYAMNPMVGIIEGFRSAMLGKAAIPFQMIIASTMISILLFFVGMLYFRRMEKYFADVI